MRIPCDLRTVLVCVSLAVSGTLFGVWAAAFPPAR